MIEQDTIKLLRECDAGIRMGVDAIEDVLTDVQDDTLRRILHKSRDAHTALQTDLQSLLDVYHDEGKLPSAVAKGMSHIKTTAKLAADRSDATIADLITDGCNMGVKSIHRYLNQYAAADEKSKNIAKRLSSMEESLCRDVRDYL